MYDSKKFDGSWICISSTNAEHFYRSLGFSTNEAYFADESRPIIKIQSTANGMKEQIILPNADEIFSDAEYTFNFPEKFRLGTTVTWNYEVDRNRLVGRSRNVDGKIYKIVRSIDKEKENYFLQTMECGQIKAYRKFKRLMNGYDVGKAGFVPHPNMGYDQTSM